MDVLECDAERYCISLSLGLVYHKDWPSGVGGHSFMHLTSFPIQTIE